MKLLLKLIFGAIAIAMAAITIRAGLAVSLWGAWDSFALNPSAVATLYDAYFAFFIFWVWVAFKETSLGSRLLWLLLIFGLGSIAMSVYVLIQLFRLQPGEPVATLLRR